MARTIHPEQEAAEAADRRAYDEWAARQDDDADASEEAYADYLESFIE